MCGCLTRRKTRSSLTKVGKFSTLSLRAGDFGTLTATCVPKYSPATTTPKPPRPRRCVGARRRSMASINQCSRWPTTRTWRSCACASEISRRDTLSTKAPSGTASSGDDAVSEFPGRKSKRNCELNSVCARRVRSRTTSLKALRSCRSRVRLPITATITSVVNAMRWLLLLLCSGMPMVSSSMGNIKTATTSNGQSIHQRMGSAM
mmetsp:Transcript_69825/g.214139  ORF Transcript_69825/g.214139 Transcript_69825/m.214139 type:complete len:205 (-) Transcript_69825:504-1118(-)